MQIEIKIDNDCKEPKVIILTAAMTSEVNILLKRLTDETPDVIAGFQGNQLEILEQENIIRIYAYNGKVFAVTSQGEYIIKLRLYEVEERLEKTKFVRISNSEVINLKKVKNFDLSLTGTICVRLSNDMVTYVSRRYVSKIKQLLGM